MVSYKSTSCTIGDHAACAFSTNCRCYCHNMERQKVQLEHYMTLDCKWGKHKECRDDQGKCSCTCHR